MERLESADIAAILSAIVFSLSYWLFGLGAFIIATQDHLMSFSKCWHNGPTLIYFHMQGAVLLSNIAVICQQ